MNFTEFLTESTEHEKDLKKTLGRLPSKWQKLIKGYTFKFQPGNTLKNDNQHIGVIDGNKKSVTLAAGWRYPREFCFLHEIGHMIWELLPQEQKEKWKQIYKNTKNKQKEEKQAAEEIFCMVFGQVYSTHQLNLYNHPEWVKFIKSI